MATLRFLVSHVCRWFHETFFLASWQIDQKLAKLNRCQVLTVPMIQSVPQDYMNNVGWQALKNQLFKEDQAAKNLVKWWENESATTYFHFPFKSQILRLIRKLQCDLYYTSKFALNLRFHEYWTKFLLFMYSKPPDDFCVVLGRLRSIFRDPGS